VVCGVSLHNFKQTSTCYQKLVLSPHFFALKICHRSARRPETKRTSISSLCNQNRSSVIREMQTWKFPYDFKNTNGHTIPSPTSRTCHFKFKLIAFSQMRHSHCDEFMTKYLQLIIVKKIFWCMNLIIKLSFYVCIQTNKYWKCFCRKKIKTFLKIIVKMPKQEG
jgi:hypothetical protein